MSLEIETTADLINTSLAVAELEDKASSEQLGLCANCGTPLVGKFCHACGQVAHLHRSVWHMGEELLHGLLHFDTKAGRTLPLLIAKPGKLTRNYIDGQRTRYVSPLALFLFMIFLMFFAFSHLGKLQDSKNSQVDLASFNQAIAEQKASLTQAQEKLTQLTNAKGSAQEIEVAQEFVDEEKQALAQLEKGLQALQNPAAALSKSLDNSKSEKNASGEAGWQKDLGKIKIDGNSSFKNSLRAALKNTDLLIYKLQNTASKYAFMLVPISLPFLWLMFCLRRDVSMYDHAVFSLYSLSFMSLLLILVAALLRLELNGAAFSLLIFVPPVHMFLQLRATYRLGFLGALWRTMVLLGVAGTVFIVFLLLVSYLSLS